MSAVNWREVNAAQSALGCCGSGRFQALAHGSDGVMFFQWRAARAAAEKFHSAMLPHGGTEARGWSETVRLGSELAALEEIAGSTARADVAFVFGWDNWWAFDGADHPSQLLDLPAIVHSWYRPFFDGSIAVDIVPPAGDLAGYRLVVAPNLYLLTDEALEALTAFVRDGGVFVCGYFSGVVDENDHVAVAAADGRAAAAAGRPGRRVLADPAGREGLGRAFVRCGRDRARLVGVARARRRRIGRVLYVRRARRPCPP